MQQASVTIEGTSAFLMHAFPMIPVEGLEKMSPEKQAEQAAYRETDGQLYFPGVNIQRALVQGATFSKGKGRASLQKLVAACVLITPERVRFEPEGLTYTVDSRPVVIAATKGRVIRHRPRLDHWRLTFTVEFDEVLLKATEMRRVIDDTGSRVGLGDFRPEKKGPFGRFVVTHWKLAER